MDDAVLAIREFHRTLNGEGLLVLTFDYPTVNLPVMNEVLLQAGFQYWGRRISSFRRMPCGQTSGAG